MKLNAQTIHSVFHVITNTCLIDLYRASLVDSCWLIYEVEKFLDQQLQAKLSPSSSSGNLELKPPFIWNSKLHYPPCLQNSSPRNPPLYQNTKMPLVVCYGYFLESKTYCTTFCASLALLVDLGNNTSCNGSAMVEGTGD